MRLSSLLILSAVCLLGVACTERRTASEPVPDGDTVEVVIGLPEKPVRSTRIINLASPEDSLALPEQSDSIT